jgi:aminopeptidase-like protein
MGLGAELHALVERLYPIPRSLTGDGVRETLRVLAEHIDLDVHEVPTGTQVLDWTVPREWNVRAAYVRGPDGAKVVDFADHSLHLVGYSVPVERTMSLAELRPHLHSLPEHPDWIPYRTSYYNETWGFCLAHSVLESLPEGDYEVVIDASLEDGHLTYAECVVPGESEEEVLLYAHVCHPSLANDNQSSLAIATLLARELAARPRRYTYRFLFAPGTIGSITWLALNPEAVARVRHGLVLACTGDPGRPTYKRSRRGEAEIDRALVHLLRAAGAHRIDEFSPWGYDERQFCSPGFDLPVGCLMRTPHGEFPEYHTSADDLDLVRPEALADTYRRLLAVSDLLERNRAYRNTSPYGEPQLGRRGLYGSLGGDKHGRELQLALLWVLNLSDGQHDLLAIAERAGIPFGTVADAADALREKGLLIEAATAPSGDPAL